MITIEAEGMDEAVGTMKKLEKLGSSIAGISFMGDDRGRVNNAEIISFHANGINALDGTIVRNITAGNDAIGRAGQAYMDVAAPFIDDPNSGEGDDNSVEREATRVSAKALKSAAEVIRLAMLDNVEKQIDRDGNPLKSVDPIYANARAAKYGVPDSVVMKASGNLLSNLSRAAYKFKKK